MRIKEEPEDFIVDEIPLDDITQEPQQYHVYKLKKRNYTTHRALKHLASSLHIPIKQITYAGTKDKQAVTTQYITIKGVSKERVAALQLKDIELTFEGYRKEPYALGLLQGNRFSILVKDVSLVHAPQQFYVPNYFDEQRFSTNNVAIGKLILKQEYKQAVEEIVQHDADHKELLEQHLQQHENDYVGALKLIPRTILLFYVHAVQSYIFNEQLKQRIQEQEHKSVSYSQGEFAFPQQVLITVDQEEGTLIGFDSKNGFEDIKPHQFINKSFPELTLEESTRPLYSQVNDFNIQEEQEGVKVQFSLSKGCYATIVLKQLFLPS